MNTRSSHQSGFSMIEVLVTILIIAIGLLGVAALQSAGLRQVVASQTAAQVQLLAQDLAELIIAYDPNGDGDYAANGVPAAGKDCAATVCNRDELANYNLVRWQAEVDIEVPSLAMQIVHTAAAVGVSPRYEVRLTWDALRQGANFTRPNCTLADSNHHGCFAMLIEL